MKFSYASGQKPLAGYTIKRGIGCGGFGEVYFGLSDSGKEVALKCIRQNLDIELRGITQCLNLKHPHLVHLYDLKQDAQGLHWLVMEFVNGEALSAVLNRFPKGLPLDLLGQWFGQLASAIHHLHDNGIVHRDLKPANIFLENGLVKVGDYGLCKFIGGSDHQAQTQNIGTVHYMAPEISTGNYNRQIDIYAGGIILYEMLTGAVPFDGESAGEILMKHLTAKPDLSAIPAPFVPILEKALHKNPLLRHATMAELGKAVAAVTNPVFAAPSPRTAVSDPTAQAASRSARLPAPPGALAETAAHVPERRWTELGGMLLLAITLALLFTMAWALIFHRGDWREMAPTFVLATASSWALLIPGRLWSKSVEESWRRRLVGLALGLALGGLALWLAVEPGAWPWNDEAIVSLAPGPRVTDGRQKFYGAFYPDHHSIPVVACWLGYFGLMFVALRWWKDVEASRPQRFSLMAVLATCFWAYVLLFLLPTSHERQIGFTTMALTSVIVQLCSPCRRPEPPRGKRLRLRLAD